MKKIILIDSKWDINSPAIKYVLKASKGTDTEIAGIFLVGDTGRETVEKAEAVLKSVKQGFEAEGIPFSAHVMGQDPKAFTKKIDDLMPASLVLIGEAEFSGEMARGGAGIKALKERLTCPVTTADAIAAGEHAQKKTAGGINWGKFIMYAIGSAIMYGVFFPMLKVLNGKIFMTGTVLGALAIMAAVVIHAWIWGNTTQILPKLFKLEK
ncbi:MAG: hypothetical protein GXP46_00235 [Deferribacteres bacterium]|nr:hypothetical protein [Deferribacteres bacterium]